jgi:hypothetical protein
MYDICSNLQEVMLHTFTHFAEIIEGHDGYMMYNEGH